MHLRIRPFGCREAPLIRRVPAENAAEGREHDHEQRRDEHRQAPGHVIAHAQEAPEGNHEA